MTKTQTKRDLKVLHVLRDSALKSVVGMHAVVLQTNTKERSSLEVRVRKVNNFFQRFQDQQDVVFLSN